MNRDELRETYLYALEHGLLSDDVGRSLIRIVDCGVADTDVIRMLSGRVARHRDSHELDRRRHGPFPLPPQREGEIVSGYDVRGRPTHRPLQDLACHEIILGTTGSGKTSLALHEASQVAPLMSGTWLIDCRKQEWAKLREPLARNGTTLLTVHGHQMPSNLLEVPRFVPPRQWVPWVADSLVTILDLPPRASLLLQRSLHTLYERMGVFSGAELFPTLFDVFEDVRTRKDSNPQSRSAILDRIEAVILELGPEVLAYRRAWPLSELANMTLNPVYAGNSDTATNLLLYSLLLPQFSSVVAAGQSNIPLRLFVAIDEGQRVLRTRNGVRNPVLDLWPLIRGTGIGLSVSVPDANSLCPEALSYTSTKVLLKCGSASDYEVMGRSMRMTSEQISFAFSHLRPGNGVMFSGEATPRAPCLFSLPRPDYPTSIPTATGLPEPLRQLSVVRAEEHFNPTHRTIATPSAQAHDQTASTGLSQAELRLLRVILEHAVPVSRIPKLAGMSSRRVIRLRKGLLAGGFVREHKVQAGTRGRPGIVLEVTTHGLEALEQDDGQAR